MRIVLAAALAAVPALALPAAAPQGGGLTIEQRLQRVEDELAIRRVLVDYSATQDAHDYESYAALFAASAHHARAEWPAHAGAGWTL